jgi:hypothetical protein
MYSLRQLMYSCSYDRYLSQTINLYLLHYVFFISMSERYLASFFVLCSHDTVYYLRRIHLSLMFFMYVYFICCHCQNNETGVPTLSKNSLC